MVVDIGPAGNSEQNNNRSACRSLGVSDKSYYRWRKLYGSIGRTEVKHCKDLEKENGRLRRIVSDLELDKSILKEALDFLGHRG